MTWSSASGPRSSSILTVVSPRSAPISTTRRARTACSTGAMATSHNGNMVRLLPSCWRTRKGSSASTGRCRPPRQLGAGERRSPASTLRSVEVPDRRSPTGQGGRARTSSRPTSRPVTPSSRQRFGTGPGPLTVPSTRAPPEFVDDHVMLIGDVRFHYEHPLDAVPAGHLGIEKLRPLLQAYVDLWAELGPRRVVELGIRRGGSTAMLCELGGLERIVSIELSDTRVEALDRYIADRGVQDTVHPWYGVDQADRERVAEIVDRGVLGTADRSRHRRRVAPVPRVAGIVRGAVPPAPAGRAVPARGLALAAHGREPLASALEASADVRHEFERRMIAEDRAAPATAMSRLVLELVIARAISGDAVADVVVGPDWAAVRRGPADLDPREFRLDDLAPDHLQLLAPVR